MLLLRVGTAVVWGRSLAPTLWLSRQNPFWGWELSSASGPDGPKIRLGAIGQEGVRASLSWLGAWELSSTQANTANHT